MSFESEARSTLPEGSRAADRHLEGPATTEGAAINTVPPHVRDAAMRAFEARRPQAPVADLVYDSLVDGDRRAGADRDVRHLRFSTEALAVDVDVTTRADGDLVVALRVVPPTRARVEVQGQDLPDVELGLDGRGMLTLAPSLVSFVIHATAPADTVTQTAWIRL